MQAAVNDVPMEPLTHPGAPPGIYASAYTTLAAIMSALTHARVALLNDDASSAITLLKEAVHAEDSLGYMEPPR